MRIDSNAKTVEELLSVKYTLDYYQREYVWQEEQVSDLLRDLIDQFREDYDENHELAEVNGYGHYFLGSIIIREEGAKRFIIDGQQRLTTLTLLLIYLRLLLEDEEQRSQIETLILPISSGTRSFNLDIPEREPIMSALYAAESLENALEISKSFIESRQQPSVLKIVGGFINIMKIRVDCPSLGTQGPALSCFAKWLIEKVCLVEITVVTDEDAYRVFETMNDRGLPLTHAEMLRGYLLSHIKRPERRDTASEVWAEHAGLLQQLSHAEVGQRDRALTQLGNEELRSAVKAWLHSNDELANMIKAWLRSQHARDMGDFKRIGSEFHRWVRTREDDLSLTSSNDFANFIERDFDFYCSWYRFLQEKAKSLTPEFECIYYNAQHNFTLQYSVLLAPLCVGEPQEESLQKIRVVSTYLDILIHRRIWNTASIIRKTLERSMFALMRDIRGKSASELTDLLYQKLMEFPQTFADNSRFQLAARGRSSNLKGIRFILARITDYVETQSGNPSRYVEYCETTGKNGYDVEHIWSDHYEDYEDEFSQRDEFQEYRNRIGGLLLLPKSTNRSLGDKTYTEKREIYAEQNLLLAQSLHDRSYDSNGGFQKFSRFQDFIAESGLPFCPHAEFRRVDLDMRQQLYQQLAEQIWHPDRLIE